MKPNPIEVYKVLSPRTLNRTLLARQFLIEQTQLPVSSVLEHLIGMQSQAPLPPYIGLWTRIESFTPSSLSELLIHRNAVRLALMRSTIFLVTSQDAIRIRSLMQPVLDRSLMSNHRRYLTDVDLNELASQSRELVEKQPQTFNDLGISLQEKWMEAVPSSLAAAARTQVPLVQIPPRGIWGKSGQALHTSLELWLDTPIDSNYRIDELILRYLQAFGPATNQDIQVWSGLTRIREVTDRLKPQLSIYLDENGNELFDLPGAEIPDADTPVPVRFLSEFDNMLLSYKDRTRIISESARKRVFTVNGIIKATILVDGFVQGIWRIEQQKNTSTLIIEPFTTLSQPDLDALTAEGSKLLDFAVEGNTGRDIQILSPM